MSGHREYVFPSRNVLKRPIISQIANTALKRIDYENRLVAHVLRLIASTAMNETGLNPDVSEAALVHSDRNKVRKTYNLSLYSVDH
ncbi:tyrosine-type recombinase/integrase [Pantoea sp. Z09]|uniref:tyrosine-type recombinase/integrase n=1 Tax=Pantoea sp. Z09 TaxID=2886821 RepID=UPI00352FFF93